LQIEGMVFDGHLLPLLPHIFIIAAEVGEKLMH
jgi:hypothetical protein